MTDHPTFRTTQSLDGPWEFRFGDQETWRTVNVPNPWQAECADLRHAFGMGHYRKRIILPAAGSRETVLRFGAASELATIRLDGREIGRHAGGYLPFEVLVPGDVPREVLLEVDTLLPSIDTALYPDHPFPEYPHGKQSWYGPLGGLWQSVSIETRPVCHIAHVAITATPEGGVVAKLQLSQATDGMSLRALILDAAGQCCWESRTALGSGAPILAMSVDRPRLWSPDTPALYRLDLVLEHDGVPIDGWSQSFGFRSIVARDGRLLLNGQPLYLRGALDQDYYPDGICTPPSVEFLEDQLRKAKQLGLNCLRCHIKVPDPRYYEVADRLGMLVWTEIPNVAQFTERSAQRLRQTFEGILRRDGNHPSIIAWTIINEDWGTRLAESPDHRAWLAETFDWIKKLDPTRLVVDNSPCVPNFHVKTDINDYHYYRGVPERRAEWDRLTDEFAKGADWTFTPHGDAQRTGSEPLIVSEFGVWGLPHPGQLRDPNGAEPWWMETGPFWGDGAAYPHGVQGRYDLLKLDRVFGSFDGFIEAVQWHQFQGLKYQIESMRAHPSIMGYVITELTDVHWEANGLLDLARNPRVFHDRFAMINADVVLITKFDRWAFWVDETVTVPVSIASGGLALPAGCRLRWMFENQSGEIGLPALAPVSVSDAVLVSLEMPAVERAKRSALTLALVDPTGRTVAQNTETVSIYPRAEHPGETVAARDAAVAAYLVGLGYSLAGDDDADVVVTRDLHDADVEAIREGRRVLLLADGETERRPTLRADEAPREPPFMPIVDDKPGTPAASHHFFPFLGLVERHGTMWRGDWIGNFSWLRRDGFFADLPGAPMLDLSFDRVVPLHVMTGFQPWEYEARVHAAVVIGWVHKPAALLCERPFGTGKLTATTFRLTRDAPDQDPVAATLLRGLIKSAAR